jgi:hypothetical protein
MPEKLSADRAERARVEAVETSRRVSNDDGNTPAPLGVTLARRAAHALGQGVFLQAVALGGMVRYLRGDRPTRWTTVRR